MAGRPRWSMSVTPGVEIATMRAKFPGLALVDRRLLVWRGPVVPISGGRPFTLEVHAARGRERPKVWVRTPRLVSEPGTRLPPHCFKDESLCLDRLGDEHGCWSDGMPLAESIVLWACEWCFFYEAWLATGEWLGPEYPHSPRKAAA
jgi:hypothetical protein